MVAISSSTSGIISFRLIFLFSSSLIVFDENTTLSLLFFFRHASTSVCFFWRYDSLINLLTRFLQTAFPLFFAIAVIILMLPSFCAGSDKYVALIFFVEDEIVFPKEYIFWMSFRLLILSFFERPKRFNFR